MMRTYVANHVSTIALVGVSMSLARLSSILRAAAFTECRARWA